MERPIESRAEHGTVDYIKQVIANARLDLQAELDKKQNDWFACLGTRIFALELALLLAKNRGNLGEEEYIKLQEKVEVLKKERKEDIKKYESNTEKLPPEEIREKLLMKLDIFRESD